LVLRILKIIATSGFLAALECTKFVFGWCSTLDPTGKAYSAPSDLLAGSRGTNSEGRGREVDKKGRGKGKGGNPPPFCKSLDSPMFFVFF